MARLALCIRCGVCGQEFDTGIRMDSRNFARATLASNYHVCPACGERGSYHKDSYIVREDPVGGRPPAPNRQGSTDQR
jgi:hypothetical protein